MGQDHLASAEAQALDWAIAGRPLPGESESGDACVVQPAGGRVLLAVIDGLGHGAAAAVAARLAVATLAGHAAEPLEALVRRCHQALLRTRGVVLTLASICPAEDSLTWIGVGNVEGVLLRAAPDRARESVLLRGGVVGGQLPPLRAATLTLQAGDTLLLLTDGIRAGFTIGPCAHLAPRQIADDLLRDHARDTDDALVLVARYLGGRR